MDRSSNYPGTYYRYYMYLVKYSSKVYFKILTSNLYRIAVLVPVLNLVDLNLVEKRYFQVQYLILSITFKYMLSIIHVVPVADLNHRF